MEILPIKLITQEDQPIFGVNIFNLTKLTRSNFPVADGIAVTPPGIELHTVLEHFKFQEKEVFEQSLTLIKKEITKISIPQTLSNCLKGKKGFLIKDKGAKNVGDVWNKLLGIWLGEIRSKIWKGGFNQDIISSLTAQLIFFDFNQASNVEVYYDPDLEETVIKSDKKLDPFELKRVDEIVINANKKLFLPQIYYFVKTKKNELRLVGVKPFTHSMPESLDKEIVIPKIQKAKVVKSAVKVFLNLSSGFAIYSDADGILIEGEKLADFDEIVFKLTEAANAFSPKPVIYKLPDINTDDDVRGALRLIHQGSLLRMAAEAFLFARNKKNLYNLALCIPFIRSSDELVTLKNKLDKLSLRRGGNLEFWIEAAVPENLINIKDYIDNGIDGVILSLEKMAQFLTGFNTQEGEYFKNQFSTIKSFIEPCIKILHKNKIPLIVKGELSLHPSILDFLVESGIWAVVTNTILEAENLPEQLHFVEKRIILKRISWDT